MINLDSQSTPLYRLDVPETKAEKKSGYVTIRLSDELKEALESLAERERRTTSQVGLFLLERGFATYTRDGLLQEPGGLAFVKVKDSSTSRAYVAEEPGSYDRKTKRKKR